MAFFLAVILTASVVLRGKPHIIHMLADDLGWSEVGYHRTQDKGDVSTPNIDSILTEGLELNSLYVHKICSPTRCALQTGRAPIHVNVQNVVPEVYNPKDKEGGYQGIPLHMTGVAEHLRSGGYSTHLVGKWDAGMAHPLQSPWARGYDTWLGYWHHANDYWQFTEETCGKTAIRDLWRHNSTGSGPAIDLAPGKSCSQANQTGCKFEEALLTDEVLRVLATNDPNERPLFLFWSMHLVHMPLQIPKSWLDKFQFINNTYRRSMHAMTAYLDNDVGRVASALKSLGFWDNTLVIFHADNGGEIMGAGICGGNNWPLRGGKFSNWEGGIRVNGWVSGGVLPASRRGQREDGMVAGWDWYATYAELAGVDPTDHRAAAAGLPPIDSVSVWPLISGTNATSPRHELAIGDTTAISPNGDGETLVGGLVQQRGNSTWKLLVGAADKLHRVGQDVLTGPEWPNASSHLVPLDHSRLCGRQQKNGCLFNLISDPLETTSLAMAETQIFNSMLARIDELQKGVYSPNRGKVDKQACVEAEGKYQGYWGPFLANTTAATFGEHDR